MKKSRAVRDGDFVSIRNGKIIKKGARTGSLRGIYRPGRRIGILTMRDETKMIDIPEGVQFFGPAKVKTSST